MEIKLSNGLYNNEKLDEEIRIIPTCQGLVERDSGLYALFVYDVNQQDIDSVHTIVANHDPTLTLEQESDEAQKKLFEDAETSKRSWGLIKAFNDGPEEDVKIFLQAGGTADKLIRSEPLNKAYAHWRSIFDILPDDQQVHIMWQGYMLSHTFEFYPEPETPSMEYKAWFNNACAQVIGYITDRALM